MTDICVRCEEKKSISDFMKRSSSKKGYVRVCKECHRKRDNEQSIKRKEKYKKILIPKTIICRVCNKEKKIDELVKDSSRKYGVVKKCKDCASFDYFQKQEERLKKQKKYYYNDHQKTLVRASIYRQNNKSKISKGKKIYYKNNREKVIRDTTIYSSKKYKNDYNYRLLSSIRARLQAALKGKNKSDRTLNLIGLPIKDYKEYLKSKFQDGMTWENYGLYGWHIDHILPCSSFDLSDSKQQQECFHYTNTQPLWALDNLKKGNKIIKESK